MAELKTNQDFIEKTREDVTGGLLLQAQKCLEKGDYCEVFRIGGRYIFGIGVCVACYSLDQVQSYEKLGRLVEIGAMEMPEKARAEIVVHEITRLSRHYENFLAGKTSIFDRLPTLEQ